MKPDWCVGTFGRMSCFSEPDLIPTILPVGGIFHAARINRFHLPALDESRPKRNGNEPRADQRGGGQDYNSRRDGDGLLPSVVSPWTESGPHHRHCFPHFLDQAKLSQQMAYAS
jgi:hypothetical protein